MRCQVCGPPLKSGAGIERIDIDIQRRYPAQSQVSSPPGLDISWFTQSPLFSEALSPDLLPLRFRPGELFSRMRHSSSANSLLVARSMMTRLHWHRGSNFCGSRLRAIDALSHHDGGP